MGVLLAWLKASGQGDKPLKSKLQGVLRKLPTSFGMRKVSGVSLRTLLYPGSTLAGLVVLLVPVFVLALPQIMVFAQAPEVEWERTFGESGWDMGISVQQTSDGGYIIAGETDSFGAGSHDVYLIKTDPSGNLVWQRTFGGSGQDTGGSVQQTSDGGYTIAGGPRSFGSGDVDVYLIKTDPSGYLVWQGTFGRRGCDDEALSVQHTFDGGYIIAGLTYHSFEARDPDVYLIRLGPEGGNLDNVSPNLVQDFTASDGEDGQSALRWTNPPDDDLAQVIVRRKTDGYPSDHTDGGLVYQDTSPTPGASVEHVDTGLTNGTTYYYAVFSRDTTGNWNDQVVEGKNADVALPAFAHVPPGGFWAEITNTPYERWRMRAEPGLSGEVVKILPEGWVIWVLDTHDDLEERDGYIWWEVRDTTDEGCQTCPGWMATRKRDGSKIYLTADPNDQNLQSILAQRAVPEEANEVDERKSLILDAILSCYYNTESGLSLSSGEQFSRLRETLFPPNIVLAIFVQGRT